MLTHLAVAQHDDLARVARHLELARGDQPQLAAQQAARTEHMLDQPRGNLAVHGGQRVIEQVDLRTLHSMRIRCIYDAYTSGSLSRPTCASAYTARASATRARCPPESRAPPTPRDVRSPEGSAFSSASRAHARSTAAYL